MSPSQRICRLIELSFNSLHNLRQAIHSSQKYRYRLLDPTAEHGVSDALDCYKFVSDNFAVAVTPNKSVLRLLKALDDEWDKLCDELIEILGANSSCDQARSALHLAHKEFTARIIDPTISSGDSLQYACDCLSSVAEEFKRYIITCGGDDNERRHQEQLAEARRQTNILSKIAGEPAPKSAQEIPEAFTCACGLARLGWTPKLQAKYEHECDLYDKTEEMVEGNIHRIHLSALDYTHRILEWMPYLRGDSDTRPEDFTHGGDERRNVGDWMKVTIVPAILEPAYTLIRNLPRINTVKHPYPIQELGEMFGAVILMLATMGFCEEELKSKEASDMGLAAIKALALQKLICPEPRADGRFVLETSLIPKAFSDFNATLCNAAWALGDKVQKRDANEIDLDPELEKLNARKIGNPEAIGTSATPKKPLIPESEFSITAARFKLTKDGRNIIDCRHMMPVYKIDPYIGLTKNAANIIKTLLDNVGNSATEGWVKVTEQWRGRFQSSAKAAYRFKNEQIEIGEQNTSHQGFWRILPDPLFIERYRKIMLGKFRCKI